MDIPVRPEPEEFPKIKRAMRAARFMSWGSTLLTGVFAIAAVIVGVFVAWYFGVALVIVALGVHDVAKCGGRDGLTSRIAPNWRPRRSHFVVVDVI